VCLYTNKSLETKTQTGIGIPSNEIEKIFLPFYQIPRSTPMRNDSFQTNTPTGAGVGLYIVSEIVKGNFKEINLILNK